MITSSRLVGMMGCYCSHQPHHHHRPASNCRRIIGGCGMRHPISGQIEDDLSRLTSSSTTTSTPSHASNGSNSSTILPIISNNNHESKITNSREFNSTYLPAVIDPLEWQKSRKRKERQDSTSSITQDRKLVRSNSEELITSNDYEVIRRVSSHEDFKRPLQEFSDENVLRTIQENESHKDNSNKPVKFRIETSPARSNRLSPHRDYRSSRYRESDETDCEHERRRSTERFSRTRAPPGRRSGNGKKPLKHIASKYRDRDENVYKYDISALKHERRGFVSKLKLEDRGRKEEAADGEQIVTNDLNDNNLINFHISQEYQRRYNSENNEISNANKHHQHQQSINNTTSSIEEPTEQIETLAEALPWDCSIQEDQPPVLCRRFASFDHCINDEVPVTLSDSITSPPSSSSSSTEPTKSFGGFTNLENLKTHEIMKHIPPPGLFQTPDERLRQVNKKLVALKKRVGQLEENFERNYGYRPSQSEKFNDRQIKNVMTEIIKLRKEKHQLKSDPMTALGLKVSVGMDGEKKLANMKDTLSEIEKKLNDKRQEASRPENLDELNAEQLLQEKTAVQHGLLYLESLYGRPITREERDTARHLYDRYRIIKRMVSRSISISGNCSGIPELPTILEHEALALTSDLIQQSQSGMSTDSTSTPDMPTHYQPALPTSNAESPSDNSGSNHSTDSTDTSNPQSMESENVHTLSLDELWEHLEKLREEKKLLKRTIKEYEASFEEQNGRKMLKTDRKVIEDTYAMYKQKKAKVRLLQALIKKKIDK